MKKLYRILALALAFVLILSGSALATGPPGYVDGSPVQIRKNLTASPLASNPVETFKFEIGSGTGLRNGEVITAPAFSVTTFDITVLEGANTGAYNLVLPTFTQVGEYTYKLNEIAGNKAGFDYDANDYYLKITVINNPDGEGFLRVLTLVDGENKDVKVDDFENKFDAGKLKITKKVAGNFGDPDDEFKVTVRLTPLAGKVLDYSKIDFGAGITPTIVDATTGQLTVEYTVKHNSIVEIKNIPYDVVYLITEETGTGYQTPVITGDHGDDGFEVEQGNNNVVITNTRDQDIPTGLDITNTPFIILLAIASVGIVSVMVRRRKNEAE